MGGIILLGVEEYTDKSLHPMDLPEPEKLVKEFWDNINNQNKVSVNILTSKDVSIQNIDGNYIVVINVPRAQRSYKPVYIDGNPMSRTYRRNGEGDWSGNVYDFYFRVYNKLQQDIKVPFKLEGIERIDDTQVHKTLREALANCLINAIITDGRV